MEHQWTLMGLQQDWEGRLDTSLTIPSEMGGVLADIPAALGAGVVDRCWWCGDE